MSETLLNISGLKTYYYTDDGIVRAVDHVDLKINRGEVLGLIGESACGKSTLALSILRLIQSPGKILDGKIIFSGKDLLELNNTEIRHIRGSQISMIFQDATSSLNPVYTIGDQISEIYRTHHKVSGKKEIKNSVIEMLTKVGIPDAELRFSDYPHQFSGGMRQRAMIAMALACNPQLLIADEPTTSLDVTTQAQILDLMRRLKEEFNTTILLVTHNMGVVAEESDKVAVMYAGKIVEYGDTITIFKKPKHPYTQALMGSIPRIDLPQEKLEIIPGKVPSLINPPTGCRFAPRCKYSEEDCKTIDNRLIEIEPGHLVSCIHPYLDWR